MRQAQHTYTLVYKKEDGNMQVDVLIGKWELKDVIARLFLHTNKITITQQEIERPVIEKKRGKYFFQKKINNT